MKTTKIVLLIILCGLILFLSVILGTGLSKDRDDFFSKRGNVFSQNYDLVLEKEVEAGDITDLIIEYDMNSNDVFFYENTKDTILIREYFNFTPRDNQLSTVQQNGSELLIKGRMRNLISFLSFGNSCNGYTEIYLPAGFCADLTVKTVSGDIRSEIPIIQCDSFAASTVSGDITLEYVEGNTDMSSTSGDICIKGGNGSRNANSVSGDISLFLTELTKNLEVSTTSGDVFLQLPEESAFTLKFSSTSGDCNTFFDDVLSFNKRGTTANGQYGENSALKVTVSTTSGNLRITAN